MRAIFKFFKVTIISLLVIVFLAFVSIAIFAYFFDLNKYKSEISAIVEKQIGRKFSINGDAKLGISLIPTLELNDVTLANATWSKNPNMLSLERLDVQVSIMPLLKKEIEIYKAILIKPMIYLEVNKQGQANWDFSSLQAAVLGYKLYASTTTTATDIVVENASTEIKLPIEGLFAKNILIENGLVEFNNQQTAQDIRLQITKFNLTSKSMDDDMNLVFDINFNGDDIKGTAKVGSLKSLMHAYNPYPIELDVKAFGVGAKVDGSVIGVLEDDIHYIMNLNVSNPKGNFGAPQASFIGTVDGNLKKVKVNIETLNVEDNIVTGNVDADISGKVPSVNAVLNSELINLMSFAQTASSSFDIPSLISSANASEMIPATPIPYEFLQMANANVKLNINSLIVDKDIRFDGVSLTAKLKDGVLKVSPLVAKAGNGTITINADVNSNNKSVKLVALSKDIEIQKLYRALEPSDTKNFAIIRGGQAELDINVETTGLTARALADNLNGHAIVIVNKSTVNSGDLALFKGNIFGQIIDMLKLRQKRNVETTLNCAVVRADIVGGKLNFPNGIAFDTTDFKLSSDGSANLRNDKISFTIKPFSGVVSDVNIAQAFSSLLQVNGTIQNPTIGLDKKQTAKAVIGLATNAPIYMASSIVLDASSAPCYTALANTRYSELFPKPTGAVATGQDAYKDVEKAVKTTIKEVGKGVKDSAKLTKKGLKGTAGELKDAATDIEDTAKEVINLFKNKKKKPQ